MAPIPKGLTLLTDAEFHRLYTPEEDPNGDTYYRQREWHDPEELALLVVAAQERRVWTMLDDDNGRMCLCNGLHYVNRIFYVITEKPYPEGANICVYDDDDLLAVKRSFWRQKATT